MKVEALKSFIDKNKTMRRRGTVYDEDDEIAKRLANFRDPLVKIIENKEENYKKKVIETYDNKEKEKPSMKAQYLGGGWYRLADGSRVKGKKNLHIEE